MHVAIGGAVAAIRSRETAGGPDPAAVEVLIAEMHDRYVMARQRTAHAYATGDADAPPAAGTGPAIELF